MAGKKINVEDLMVNNEVHGAIWNRVCTCESFGDDLSGFLKAVEYGDRKYTSIDAYVQIKKATEVFGPMGCGWGVKDLQLIGIHPVSKATRRGTIEGLQAMFKGTFWYHHSVEGLRFTNGEIEVMEDIFLDASGDSCKKVLTGMITKALSYLGWNYDVFRGRFNDVKTFESAASDEEKALLTSLMKKVKPAAAEQIKVYHDTRGWLRSDVLADIKKIEGAIAAKAKKEGGSNDPVGEQSVDQDSDHPVSGS